MSINKFFCVTFLTSLFCIQPVLAEESEIFFLEAEESRFLKNGIEITNPYSSDIEVTKKCISKSELPSLFLILSEGVGRSQRLP